MTSQGSVLVVLLTDAVPQGVLAVGCEIPASGAVQALPIDGQLKRGRLSAALERRSCYEPTSVSLVESQNGRPYRLSIKSSSS